MTRIGFALLALLAWLPAPAWAQPWLPAPSAPVAAAPAPERAPAPPAEGAGERPAAEPVAAPRPGPGAEPRPAAADQAVGLAPSGSSLTASALRLIGALAVVGILLAAGRMAARRFLVPSSPARRSVPSGRFLGGRLPGLGRWFASAGAVEEDLAVVGRSRLGARESVCVVRSGQERFLVGVSQAGISLLARLGSLAAPPAGAAEPAEAAEAVGVALPEEGELSRAPRRGERTWESPERSEAELSRAPRRGERTWESPERSEQGELSRAPRRGERTWGSPERSQQGELSRAARRGERIWESPERSEEPAADDFAAELAHATVPPHESPEGERTWGSPERSELAELLARSRERLLRLTLSSSSPHAKQRRG